MLHVNEGNECSENPVIALSDLLLRLLRIRRRPEVKPVRVLWPIQSGRKLDELCTKIIALFEYGGKIEIRICTGLDPFLRANRDTTLRKPSKIA